MRREYRLTESLIAWGFGSYGISLFGRVYITLVATEPIRRDVVPFYPAQIVKNNTKHQLVERWLLPRVVVLRNLSNQQVL